MPRIYLSPSLQEYNTYINGGTEEQVTNEIADAMEPYLMAMGIEFVRNRPEMTLGEAIADSNSEDFDFHLAIHSNAAPESMAGMLTGPDEFRTIYPNPEKVDAVPTTTLRELRRTNAPSALVEVAYHDNPQDAAWIKENIQLIAAALSRSLARYFGIPFVEPAVE